MRILLLHKKMYTLSKGPSKFVAKARRGLTQKLERLDSRDHTRRSPADSVVANPATNDEGQVMNGPKPVFHSVHRKLSSQRSQQEQITPQHEELIKYIYDTWSSVCKDFDEETPDKNQNTSGSIIYFESTDSSEMLRDFKPFDLESWWGKRLYNNITKSL